MDLNEVAIFIQVIQSGSFSGAAKKLGMPNSTVSSKISSLEKRLGVTLIQRTTRKLNITPMGQSYFKKCIQGLEEIRGAELEMASSHGEPQGLLRITMPVELAGTVLPDLVSDFSKKYPKVNIDIFSTDRYIDLLSENVDLAIRAGELKDSTLIAKKIGESYFVPLASPKYLKARGHPSHPRELYRHQCLQFTQQGYTWNLQSAKGMVSAPLPGRIVANSMSMIKAMALKGDGIAMMPMFFCYAEVEAGKLVRVLPEWTSKMSPFHFVYPAQRFVMPKLSAFIAMAHPVIKKIFEDF